MDFHLETDRLYLRRMTDDDFPALCAILQDPTVMTAYEHAFSDQEVADWLSRQQMRYQKDGFGLWAVELKQTGTLIGQCGITLQKYQNAMVPEIGYLFQKAYWHCGYATEAALTCKQYAFETLQIEEVYLYYPRQQLCLATGRKTPGNDPLRNSGKILLWNVYATCCLFGKT